MVRVRPSGRNQTQPDAKRRRPDATGPRTRVLNVDLSFQRPVRLMHWMHWTQTIFFADVGWQYHSEESEGGEQRLTPGDGAVG